MTALPDRRRINGPLTGSFPPTFSTPAAPPPPSETSSSLRPLYLKTALTPPASGSAYLELPTSSLKLTASVYGPRPLPPSAGFSSSARVSCELKFAPFASKNERRGYVRDALERDLSAQVQVAVQGMVKRSAYPKSGIDVFVTVLDCDETESVGISVGTMQVLAGAVNCVSTAIADAGIECVDLVSAGCVALRGGEVVRDPREEMEDVEAGLVVGYMAARDEVTLVWCRGDVVGDVDTLVESAVEIAAMVRGVVNEAASERVRGMIDLKEGEGKGKEKGKEKEDVQMSG